MAVLRFPNSQSDVNGLVERLTIIATKYPDSESVFSLDDMRDALAERRQISSSGATGALAVERSTREDRSRDPLYNQVKMMSETYRMFGLIRSKADNRLAFRMTNLGLTLALDAKDISEEFRSSLIRESALSVVFPNENTNNVGVLSQRPFSWLLRLAHRLGGFITRDEIILGVLGVVDDSLPNLLDNTAEKLLLGRGLGQSRQMVLDMSGENQVQANTLGNYTRLPIGLLSSPLVNWAQPSELILDGVGKTIKGFELTPLGTRTALALENSFDLRKGHLIGLTRQERVQLADFGYYQILAKSGLPGGSFPIDFGELKGRVEPILRTLGFREGQFLLYNPELQEEDAILNSPRGN